MVALPLHLPWGTGEDLGPQQQDLRTVLLRAGRNDNKRRVSPGRHLRCGWVHGQHREGKGAGARLRGWEPGAHESKRCIAPQAASSHAPVSSRSGTFEPTNCCNTTKFTMTLSMPSASTLPAISCSPLLRMPP